MQDLSEGPNARPKRGAPLSSGVITPRGQSTVPWPFWWRF